MVVLESLLEELGQGAVDCDFDCEFDNVFEAIDYLSKK